jgi:hypothetical protein
MCAQENERGPRFPLSVALEAHDSLKQKHFSQGASATSANPDTSVLHF